MNKDRGCSHREEAEQTFKPATRARACSCQSLPAAARCDSTAPMGSWSSTRSATSASFNTLTNVSTTDKLPQCQRQVSLSQTSMVPDKVHADTLGPCTAHESCWINAFDMPLCLHGLLKLQGSLQDTNALRTCCKASAEDMPTSYCDCQNSMSGPKTPRLPLCTCRLGMRPEDLFCLHVPPVSLDEAHEALTDEAGVQLH